MHSLACNDAGLWCNDPATAFLLAGAITLLLLFDWFVQSHCYFFFTGCCCDTADVVIPAADPEVTLLSLLLQLNW